MAAPSGSSTPTTRCARPALGATSPCVELPGYAPPEWLEDEAGRRAASRPRIESRVLRAHASRAPLVASGRPRAQPAARRPRRAGVRGALVARDAPRAGCRRCARLCSRRSSGTRSTPPRRATRGRSRTRSCPSLGDASVRIGMGASLGALALLHAHRRHPETFDALFLQSGSFFRRARPPRALVPALRPHLALRRHDARPRPAERPIPVTITCGTVEENLASKRAMFEALRRQGYDVRFPGVPRRPQLGRVARLLPPAPAPAHPKDVRT